MRQAGSALGTAFFLVIAPGTTAVLIPWLLTGWNGRIPPLNPALRLAGFVLTIGGAAVLISAFIRFVAEGNGTPAPVAPTERLVVGGHYRHVRNPMYLAVTAVIVGQGLVLGRSVLFLYAAVFLLTTAAFVRVYEEPTLRDRYGAEYEEYRHSVPGWWPRLRPWSTNESGPSRPDERGS